MLTNRPDAGLILSEGGYTFRVISGDARMTEAYALRRRVFQEELGWAVLTEGGLELDGYDRVAVPFGVYGGDGELAAYIRLVPPGRRFMVESEFSWLVGQGRRIEKGPDTAEVSRLCVSPEARDGLAGCMPDRSCVLQLLLKGLYTWCLGRGIRYLYAVVDERAGRLYVTRGLPLRPIGEPALMPDGALVRAVLLDWREFEEKSRVKNPGLLEWFQAGSASPSPDATAAA